MSRMQVLAPGYLCQQSLRGLLTTKSLLGMNNGHLKNNGLIFGINIFKSESNFVLVYKISLKAVWLGRIKMVLFCGFRCLFGHAKNK